MARTPERFSQAFNVWFQHHLSRRTGERRDRLRRGLRHGEKLFLEKVWWPLFGHFDHLHPEFEVADWRGKKFFVDFLWSVGTSTRVAFEIKGYGPHVEEADRTSYRRELCRELFLQGLGLQVVSIPYDELAENAALIKSLVQMIVMPYIHKGWSETDDKWWEREVTRMAVTLGRPVRPVDVKNALDINERTAVKYLKRLCEKGKFRAIPAGRSGRICRYEYIGTLS